MASLWPWLALAGAGALHGLHPASGWLAAAVWRLRSPGAAAPRRALWPIAAGHAVALALAASGIALGTGPDRGALRLLALALAPAAVALQGLACLAPRAGAPAGLAGHAMGAFAAATIQGTGLMLVPALMPGCGIALQPAGTGGPLALAAAAIGVHTAAMLAVNGAMAACIGRAAQGPPRLSIRLLVVRRALEAVERFRRPMTPKDTP